MTESDEQRQWRRDARALADLGRELAQAEFVPIEIRMSRPAAEIAVATWEREDGGQVDTEDFEQRVVRFRAAALALIGLAVSERGRWEADGVYVKLSPDLVGVAIEWSELA